MNALLTQVSSAAVGIHYGQEIAHLNELCEALQSFRSQVGWMYEEEKNSESAKGDYGQALFDLGLAYNIYVLQVYELESATQDRVQYLCKWIQGDLIRFQEILVRLCGALSLIEEGWAEELLADFRVLLE